MPDSSRGAACCAPTPGVIIQRCVPPGRFASAACHACGPPVSYRTLAPCYSMKLVFLMTCGLLLASGSSRAQKPQRGRDLGIPFEGTPGPLNAITDVAGVEVGHRTLIAGTGKLVVGTGPVRTGVTAIFPRGKASDDPVFAGWFAMNGNGEMTGTTWVDESGFLWGPVMITNTHSVGVVRDAVIQWVVRQGRMAHDEWSLPVVAETWDGGLNDINGFHVTKEDAWAAMDSARGGPVVEGSVGGGTGMGCNRFKGGVGATDAPLLPHQSKRIAKRAALGVGRMGGLAAHSSGDIFIAFSTANPHASRDSGLAQIAMAPDERITPLFEATVQATEEAIVNAMLAAGTMSGADDLTVYALPHDRLREVLRRYNRLNP